ncbi:MAG: hypothetical protein A3K19_12235 [Lentisphaerae bacterium RIFOXYB12_FULL_65_16]|nr:MAG: hypothetical protein A3K18_28080 [Lentisphaerae bacterium RIFOXYA12_64_32]OGV86175.1 MAG: hypothetical protein A3K19_12235 [Lentisphaerae bacterium RIFOXYB12_FULL_65_16]
MPESACQPERFDPRVRRLIAPGRVVWTGGAVVPENLDALLRPGCGQASLTAPKGCVLRKGAAFL